MLAQRNEYAESTGGIRIEKDYRYENNRLRLTFVSQRRCKSARTLISRCSICALNRHDGSTIGNKI